MNHIRYSSRLLTSSLRFRATQGARCRAISPSIRSHQRRDLATDSSDDPPKPSKGKQKDDSLHADTLSQTLGNSASVLSNLGDSIVLSATSSPLFGAGITALVGLGVVFAGGVIYVEWYKNKVLDKIEEAFAAGYDPALQLADHGARSRSGKWDMKGDNFTSVDWAADVQRAEQDIVDQIIHGARHGHYILLMGSKGVGKTTMILDAMRRVEADGVAICEAHEDLEVFRLRLGKALNYEYNEDSQTGLFQRRDPREGGPRLDIERALNKLEKVALRMAHKRRKPLVLVFNNIQLFCNDEDSRQLLQQLQQKAESWAESHLITVVFSSDDFWPYPLLRYIANRMQVLWVSDLTGREALSALRHLRNQYQGAAEDDSTLGQALKVCGGRLSYLNHLAHVKDLLKGASELLQNQKGWLLSEMGLIPDCDDDVMDEQKVCASTWLLLREFVKQYREKEKELVESGHDPSETPLPELSYYKCRQIMTRADFIETLDHLNIIAIDTNHQVRPDSMVLLKAAMDVVEEEGFDDLLDNVRARIDEIESLHRTRELTWKASPEGDLVRVVIEGKKRWWNPFT